LCNEKLSTDDASYSHYKRHHDQHITRKWTIRDIHREFRPESYPDLDFNHRYGLLLSRQKVVLPCVSPTVAGFVNRHERTPALIYHDLRDIWDGYRQAFMDFFDADPISPHGHTSDAANPFLVGSLILHL
jgi:hypothetical protein